MRLAVRCGASAVGLVSAMPSGPGPISEEEIAAIAALVPPPVASFLLTSRQEAEAVVAQQKKCGTNTIQLCDRMDTMELQRLRTALPGIALVQVIHVRVPESLDEAARAAGEVDALLLDSGRPDLPLKELGGTGRRHDWRISRRIREESPVPVFLAGGLRPENVREAIEEVGPFAVDVCSGVRSAGRLDPSKLLAFFTAAGF